MRNGMEVMSLLYLGGRRQQPALAGETPQQLGGAAGGGLLLLYERVDAPLPGGHLQRQVCDG